MFASHYIHLFFSIAANFPNDIQRQGLCKPLAQCAIFYAEIPRLLERPCQLRSGGQNGVCCPIDKTGSAGSKPNQSRPNIPIKPGVGNDGVISSPPPPDVAIPQISTRQLQEVAEMSLQTFKLRVDKIQDILFIKKVRRSYLKDDATGR